MVWVRSMIGWTAAAMLALTTVVHAGAGVPLTPGADGHATVPVFVDGKGPYPFILDTGADGSAVYAWFARQARLAPAPGGDQVLTGQTGSEKVQMYEIGRATLDGHAIAHVAAFELPDRRDRGEEAGVLGNDFMDGTLVAFNFPCRRVQLYPRVDAVRIAGAGAPSVAAGSVPGSTLLTLPVTINGYTGIAELDTGSRQSRMTRGFARAAGIHADGAAFRDAAPIYGTSLHPMVPRVGSVGTVSFAGVTLHDVTMQVVDLPSLEGDFGSRPAMLLGADLLGRYRLLYDHAGHRIWLRPSRCTAQH